MFSGSAATADDEPSLNSHCRTSAMPLALTGTLSRRTAAHADHGHGVQLGKQLQWLHRCNGLSAHQVSQDVRAGV